jgi:alkaline phosphatase
VSHNLNRNRYLEIAAEIVRSVKPEVVIGGGHPDSTTTYMSRALLAELRNDPSYVVAERRAGANGTETLASAAQAARAAGKRLFGLFGGPDGNFESPVPVDAPGSPEVRRGSIEEPLLADATVAALDVLGRDPDGFFVLIEQGDIDWANHDHDYARMIGTVWDLDRAVRAAAAFVDRPGDDITWNNTLMIVTADHANGGLRFAPGARLRAGDLPAQEGKRGAFTYPGGEVSYGAAGHTNELVMLYARGAGVKTFEPFEGAWYPCTHIVDNTQIFRAMMQAAGLTLPSPLHPTVVRPASCPGEGR